MQLHRFWFEFDFASEELAPAGTILGCGVTAFTHEDAVSLLEKSVFRGTTIPEITKVVKDIDVRSLDECHVRPNMGIVSDRGVWFPLGYDGA